MRAHHQIIIIPGLSDKVAPYLLKPWSRVNATIHLFEPSWRSSELLELKLERLAALTTELATHSGPISIIGISAGGSLALNALAARPNTLNRVVNICGRLRSGSALTFPTLKFAARTSQSFYTSVTQAELIQQNLPTTLRTKILTFRPIWDETVPVSTVSIEGATNRRLISLGHSPSIALCLQFYRNTILKFLA